MSSYRHKKFFDCAYSVALSGPGVGGRNRHTFKLGAVIVDRKRVVMARFNCLKTHTKLRSYSPWPYLHAESYAILSLGLENCNNKTMYVVRVRSDGSIGLALPCSSCMALIKAVGIREVFYSTYEGYETWK